MRPTPTEAEGRLGATAVGLTLAIMLAVSLGCMVAYTRNIGIAEDWQMVRAMTGNEPDLAGWLWSQNNEHRLPVQRLIYLMALKATGDFRSGMVLNQLMLAGLAAAMAYTAAKLRGRADWRDIVFPLALLHLGHWENLLWGWQIQFVWSTVLAGLVVVVIVRRPTSGTPLSASALGGLAVLLAISGANGILIAGAVGCLLAILAMTPSNEPSTKGMRLKYLTGAALVGGAIGLYFIGFEIPPWSPPPADFYGTIKAAGTYYAMALGPGTRFVLKPAATGVVLFMAAAGLLAAWNARWGDPRERTRALGLMAMIAAAILLGLAIGRGRGALPYGLPARHSLFSALGLISALYSFMLYAPPAFSRAVQTLLVIALIALLPLNTIVGFEWRDWYVRGVTAVEAAIAAGHPAERIAHENFGFLKHWDEKGLVREIEMLKKASVGPFAKETN